MPVETVLLVVPPLVLLVVVPPLVLLVVVPPLVLLVVPPDVDDEDELPALPVVPGAVFGPLPHPTKYAIVKEPSRRTKVVFAILRTSSGH